MVPRRTLSFDRVAPIYDRSRRRPSGVEEAVRAELAQRLEGGSVLELGVGSGRILGPLLGGSLPGVVGVDVSRRMLALARRQGAQRLVRADARELPFPDRRFRRAMSTHLLHLVPEWRAVLEEVARVTQEEYLSVLEYETSVPDLSVEYTRALQSAGAASPAPGMAERKLAEQLPPDTVRTVSDSSYVRPAVEELEAIEARSYRFAWETPDGLHRRLVAQLRSAYAGAELQVQLRVDVVGWAVNRLGRFARADPPTQNA